MYYDRDVQPFPDDRQLPAELADPDSLFDPIFYAEPADDTPLSEDDYQRFLKTIPIMSRCRADELRRSRYYDAGAVTELALGHLRIAAWMARKTLNLPNQDGREDDPDARKRRGYPGRYIPNLASLAPFPLPLMDRIQEGNITLLRAAENSQPGKGTFVGYATSSIEGSLINSITKYGLPSGARVTSTDFEKIKTIELAEAAAGADGYEPSDAEIANDTGLSRKIVGELRRARDIHWVRSFEEINQELEPGSLSDSIADPDEDVEAQVLQSHMEDQVDALINTLSERETAILVQYFGLRGQEPKTLKEISAMWGITSARVGQIKNRALAKLRLKFVLEPERTRKPAITESPAETAPLIEPAEQAPLPVAPAIMTPEPKPPIEPPTRILKPVEPKLVLTPEVKFLNTLISDIKTMARVATMAGLSLDFARDIATDRFREAGDVAQTEVLEWAWNNHLPKMVWATGKSFDYDRFATYFFRLVDLALAEHGVMYLAMPENSGHLFSGIGRGLTHGELQINGSVGDYCGDRISGSAAIYVHGNARDMAGAHMTDYASLDISGSVGERAGYKMSGDSRLNIGGRTGQLLADGATSGTISVGGKTIKLPSSSRWRKMVSQYLNKLAPKTDE